MYEFHLVYKMEFIRHKTCQMYNHLFYKVINENYFLLILRMIAFSANIALI